MALKYLSRLFAQISGKVPLRITLILPFIVQLFGVVGLIGYVSVRNSQRAINDVVTQLLNEQVARVEKNLEAYLRVPHQVNQINATTIRNGQLDLENISQLENYFWQQLQIFDVLGFTGLGLENKVNLGAERLTKDTLHLRVSTQQSNYIFETYSTNQFGERAQLLSSIKFDPRTRPWYKAAVASDKPTWSEIYPNTAGLTAYLGASKAFYNDQGKLQGVLLTNINLSQIGDFLGSLEIGKTGQTFIIERSGMLVATSTGEKPFRTINEAYGAERVQAIKSQNYLTQATAKYLTTEFQLNTSINHRKYLQFKVDNQRQFLNIKPFQDQYGLDWLIVIVIPEIDFLDDIYKQSKITIILCLLALVLATGIGILTSRWVVQPILKLKNAATALSEGEFNQKIELNRDDEVGELAKAFNSMAFQLQKSFNLLTIKNKQLKRLDKLKDEFLANTSHELRTPLNGIIGITESLIDGAAGELSFQVINNLSLIVISGKRLSNLINDILDFYKLKHSNIELQLKPVGAREVAEIVISLSRSMIGTKSLQIINSISYDTPCVDADENRLQQIFYNLIGNAVKFTESGKIEVSAKVLENQNSSDDISLLEITVADTGIGIPSDKLDRIFASFEQGDGSTERQYGGTGLGLPITKKLVELHGGTISVKSTPGMGSEFTFTLNISEEPAQNSHLESSPQNQMSLLDAEELPASVPEPTYLESEINQVPTSNLASSSKKEAEFTILIVDDEPVNLTVLFNQLSLHNYQVIQANNGQKALDLLAQDFLPDLILLDVMMPGMTGYEVTQKVRETWPLYQLPIMMLTAKNRVSDLVIGLEAGANDYLSKPFHKEELLARIKTHINIKKLRREKAHIRQTFGRYVTEEVVDNVLETPEGLKLGGERKKVTLLTSDLRGFTSLSERLAPEEVVSVLNFYLSSMADIIISFQGTIDEFMGDGILVLFGALNPRKDDAKRAIACAVAMQQKMELVNKQMEVWGYSPLEMGIGINTGEVVVGNIGSEKRTKYGVVGNQVNLTYRIESYSTSDEILISETTLIEVGRSILRIDGQKLVQPKGVKQPINIYNVGGIAGEYNIFLQKEEEIFLDLAEEILIQYIILEGKHVGENLFSGSLVKLSAKGALVKSDSQEINSIPSVLTNVKINLFPSTNLGAIGEDIYAKVVDKPVESGYFYILFTSKPQEVKALLDVQYSKLIPS